MTDIDQDRHVHTVRGAGPAHAERDEKRPTDIETHGSDAAVAQAGLADPDAMLRLQHSAGNTAVSSMLQPPSPSPGDAVRAVIDSPGRPLDAGTADVVSAAVGRDMSAVKVHEGPEAAASAQAIGAELYATGQHVVAPRGLDTRTEEGLFKTVHEFVHIGQQADGPVEGTVTEDGLQISDPSDRFEQEANVVAEQAVADHHQGHGVAG